MGGHGVKGEGPLRGGGLVEAAVRRVAGHVEENLAGPLPVAELAAVANLSPHHFSRMFKRSTGTSPHRYVVRRRVERAREMLARTEISVEEVARLCGFANRSHLARHTRRFLGTTPRALRSTARGRPPRDGAR